MSVEFGGSPAETGSTYHWSGNDKVGEGRMTIVEQRPPERLVIRLEFLRPWSQTSTTTFALAPEGAGTRITWAMSGESDFLGKLTSLFLSFDRMVGPDFERGLAALAEQAAAEARAGASALSSPAPGP
jgi:uncharacterized protein YndB with AHSA1/START domain